MVIDISFETMGGILAASFLATLDQLISERCKGHGMLFTRSVILVSPDSCLNPASVRSPQPCIPAALMLFNASSIWVLKHLFCYCV